ncbi:hypothetical protein [Harryflintia acetispora]|uniref:Uncharacterized protein n=1 Tax=Harryflintia acetispora TaxID=1849041 RepID=A0A9X8Y9J8_9FIRM|nr:hypothetical protein [Harryflintia acetispora]TCL45234.1 hypothetical protein EDD78_101216 [Harryflintia acetispora]
MCIYYGDMPDLTYIKREHIFPAGLGGKMMLPQGCVSDQANELFSQWELDLMRCSTISIIRAMEGPGKRGSSSPSKASTSEICIYESDDKTFELGYIKAGKPYSIPQIRISTNMAETEFHFITPRCENEPEEILTSFKNALSKFSGKFVSIRASELGVSSIIVGTWSGKFYVAFSESPPTVQFLADQIALFCEKAKVKEVLQRDTLGKFELHLMESADSCRVYAKIAYNVLAYFRGEEFIQDIRFKEIRNWILGKSDTDRFVSLPKGFGGMRVLKFPEKAHFCFFMRSEDGKLVAIVCLYSAFLHTFEFADWDETLDAYEFPGFLGLICDWKQKQEYTMNEWIIHLLKK